jgi:hypothetical protein
MLAQGAVAATHASEWIEIVASGVVGGAVSAFLFAFAVRFDLRVIPAVIGVYAIVAAIADGIHKSTVQSWTLTLVAAGLAFAISWIATRYLVARGELPQPAPEPAAAQ